MVKHLGFWKFEHRPILLEFSLKEKRYCGVNRFHHELCWEDKEDCKKVVRNSWHAADGRSNMQRVINRLGACSTSLKSWNGKNRLNMNKAIMAKKKDLVRLDGMDRVVDWKQRNSVEKDLDELLRCEETFWKQRSGVSWLKEGDCNTKFFHAKASSRRCFNRLRGLFDA
ncbi:hypothetical protein Dsin_028802 [Dipteronia sinensis]|uniref:Uncharacterized protein n=1 Tax=Dipteronia sinensis TaxID=43782 RepID=A0AAD9ZSR2_9ROSI|nr:hypothetical protein Dsin_028802 [Dipteronia sinensis]